MILNTEKYQNAINTLVNEGHRIVQIIHTSGHSQFFLVVKFDMVNEENVLQYLLTGYAIDNFLENNSHNTYVNFKAALELLMKPENKLSVFLHPNQQYIVWVK